MVLTGLVWFNRHLYDLRCMFSIQFFETKNKQQKKYQEKKSNEEKQIKNVLILIVLAVPLGDFIQKSNSDTNCQIMKYLKYNFIKSSTQGILQWVWQPWQFALKTTTMISTFQLSSETPQRKAPASHHHKPKDQTKD